MLRRPAGGGPCSGITRGRCAPPERIPSQVQCLDALLREREATIDQVTLAVSADRCGTFRAGTPEPTPATAHPDRPAARTGQARSHDHGRTRR